ncbi:MAG: GNAT family N-acetyltransferase [Cyanobacteria bacterium P01_G01_bin.49]
MLESVSLTYRNAAPEDESFLFKLYTSTRTEELDAWGWNTQQHEAFLKMQFQAQQISYRNQFPNSNYQIILIQKLAVGAMLVIRKEAEIHLVDLALLPEYRDQGIGTFLLQNLLIEAAQTRKPVRLQVIQVNRAFQLYQRLGFSTVGNNGIHFAMEWLPPNIA